MKTKLIQNIFMLIGLGIAASTAHCQQFTPELKCNVGPISVSSGGSIGIRGVGLGASYNPGRQELCSGVAIGGGAGLYGQGSAQLCGTPDGRRYVKAGVGAGYGVGVDGASVGCVVMEYGSRQVSPPVTVPLPHNSYRPVPLQDVHATR